MKDYLKDDKKKINSYRIKIFKVIVCQTVLVKMHIASFKKELSCVDSTAFLFLSLSLSSFAMLPLRN
jgi:hypothetical protein